VTTVATDGATMACDGRGCKGDIILAEDGCKILRLGDGSLLGVAGNASTQYQLAKWIEGRGEFPNDANFGAVHLLVDGQARLYASDGGEYYAEVDLPLAIGSGAELALGAMLAGASPQKAVLIASRRDPFTGGTISTLHLEKDDA